MEVASILSAYGIVLLPLLAAVAITLFSLRSRVWSARLAITSLLLGFFLGLFLFVTYIFQPHSGHGVIFHSFPWITLATLSIRLGVIVDPLSILMSLVVTGVGSAIFIYSQGYMHDDPSYARYFAKLAFFAFSMLGIVFSVDLLQLFIFWELVGLASYLLIGFWYHKPSAADAGMKAFLVNRVGDFGFIIGILLLWSLAGTLFIPDLMHWTEGLRDKLVPGSPLLFLLPLCALLLFAGVAGKSAQFPLHVWLPDAMEGPTPVSALIHAATMVAAGIYLLCRMFFLYGIVPNVLTFISWIGGSTALFAAVIALTQFDIKRILAFSTLSQLGYMVMALGLGGYSAAMFHLSTHAFFKALLFMGAGSIIHALHSQDIREMGGILRKMRVTSTTFIVGSLALAGIFPLSGFWSKDEILSLALVKSPVLFGLAMFTAMLTAFYVGRLCFTVFFGTFRGKHEPHESPRVMTDPLVFLAILSVVGGFFGIPAFVHHALGAHVEFNLTVALLSSIIAGAGILGAALVYYWKIISADTLRRASGSFYTLVSNKFYVDELYGILVWKIQQGIAAGCGIFERNVIIQFAVNGIASMTRISGGLLRLFQTGIVQNYAFGIILGATIILGRYLILR